MEEASYTQVVGLFLTEADMVLLDTGGRLETLDNSWCISWSITTPPFRYRKPMAITLSLACYYSKEEVAIPDQRSLTFRKVGQGHACV